MRREKGAVWIRRPASTPATITWTCVRCRPSCGSRGCRAPRPSADRTWSSATASRSGCAKTACSAAVGTLANSALLKSLSAIGRAGIEDDGFRAGNPKLRLAGHGPRRSVGVGDLRTARARAADRRSRRCRTPATRRGTTGRSRSSTRSRPIGCASSRSCPATRREAAAAELERCAELGHRGAIIDVFDIDVGDPAWDRLWAAAEHTGLPISFHLKGGTWSGLSYQMGKWQSAAFATVMPLQLDEPLATMMFSGALERHPGLTLVLAESGVGWLPYFLARADLEWHSLRDKIDDVHRVSRRASCSVAR